MSTYGQLLLCPLCQELFTHPVLLPCQHSLCYGCARAQLLSDSMDEGGERTMETERTMGNNSESLSGFSMFSHASPPRASSSFLHTPDSSCMPKSDISLSSDSGMRTDFSRESSILLTTKDCLRFEQQIRSGSSSPQGNSTKLSSPLPSCSQTKSITPGIPMRPKPSKLRRSNSTSSMSRPRIAKCRPQQIYGTLKRSKVKSLFCPNCREMVELGKHGIAGLFRNFALETIVERFRLKAKAAVAIRCGYCKPPAADATRSCLDCKLSYCNECYKTVHIWGTKKAKHNFIGPTNNFSRPKVLLCPEHMNEVSLYCNKCKTSVCRLCKSASGAHINHSITSAKIACREGKERLFTELEKLLKKKDEVDQRMKLLGSAFQELESREAETREIVHSSLDGMYRLLEAKRSELLGKAESKFRNHEQYLRQELQCHNQCLMATSISSFAEEVLKENDPIFFLQAFPMLEQKLKEVLSSLSVLNESAVVFPSSNLRLDLGRAKDELDKVDFIETSLHSQIVDHTSSFQNENFCWILHNPNQNQVRFDRNGKTVNVPSVYWEPCIFRGNLSYSSGNYSWHLSVTSRGARRILIGVSSLNPGDKFNYSGSIGRNGAFMAVEPGSVSLIDGGTLLSYGSCNKIDEVNARVASFSIGTHCYAIRISLTVNCNDALVQFFDIKDDQSFIELFQKSFKCVGPVYPLLVVHGEATVSLL